MKTWLFAVFLCSLLCVSGSSNAQQCGYGAQDGAQCIPADQVPGYQDSLQDAAPKTHREPPARWADRWGAIAIDSETSSVGVSESQPSKSSASTEALQHCASKSNNQNCKVQKAYYNQCAALAWGPKYLGQGYAETVAQAQSVALQACQEGGASDCKVVYSACSLPVRVQ